MPSNPPSANRLPQTGAQHENRAEHQAPAGRPPADAKGGKVGVVVADPVPLYRAGTMAVLRSGMLKLARAVGEAPTAAEGAKLANAEGAGVLLVGDATAEDIREAVAAVPPSCAVVALVSRASRGELVEMLEAGVAGIAPRALSPDQLVATVDTAAASQLAHADQGGAAPESAPIFTSLPVALTPLGPERGGERLDGSRANHSGDGRRPAELTPKEREVLAHLARGRSTKEIAAAMYLTPATVKTHLAHIYSKLGARGRHEALARAFASGELH